MADVIAAMLREGGLQNVFSVPVPASLCAEPIAVVDGEYERTAETVAGERGVLTLKILCVRNVLDEAREIALQARTVLRDTDWERYAEAGDVRICGMKVGYPEVQGRDRSGRWICSLPLDLAVVTDDE